MPSGVGAAALVGVLVLAAGLIASPHRTWTRSRSRPPVGASGRSPTGAAPAAGGLPAPGRAAGVLRRRPGAGSGWCPPDLVLDLVAAALRAGTPADRALDVVGEAVGGPTGDALRAVAARVRLGAADAAWAELPARLTALRDALRLSAETGVAAASLLDAAAVDERRVRHRRAQTRAARLGVRLVLPLGVCALPAFVAWGVVPVVLSLAQGPWLR